MTPLRVVIVDQDAATRERIRRLLASESDVAVVGEVAHGAQAAREIERLAPDVVFLDVQMRGSEGLAVVNTLPVHALPVVIFVTTHDQEVLEAFDVHALDYLIEPFDARALHQVLDRARVHIAAGSGPYEMRLKALIDRVGADKGRAAAVPPRTGQAYLERLTVRANGHARVVRVPDVDWIESSHNYVRIHIGQETYRLRESLTEMAKQLDPTRFSRIHRFTIVNIDRVREVQPWFSGDYIVILQSGQRLRMSRTYRGALKVEPEGIAAGV
jgi:two-component system, LytTR family, response regulator